MVVLRTSGSISAFVARSRMLSALMRYPASMRFRSELRIFPILGVSVVVVDGRFENVWVHLCLCSEIADAICFDEISCFDEVQIGTPDLPHSWRECCSC